MKWDIEIYLFLQQFHKKNKIDLKIDFNIYFLFKSI